MIALIRIDGDNPSDFQPQFKPISASGSKPFAFGVSVSATNNARKSWLLSLQAASVRNGFLLPFGKVFHRATEVYSITDSDTSRSINAHTGQPEQSQYKQAQGIYEQGIALPLWLNINSLVARTQCRRA